jgi:hypothetical protein
MKELINNLWNNWSHMGATHPKNKGYDDKVILCNQIAISIALLMILVSFTFYEHPIILSAYLSSIFSYGFVIYLNSIGKFTISRIYFIALAGLGTLVISSVMHTTTYIPQKNAIISSVILPLLLFGPSEKRGMVIGILYTLVIYFLLDYVSPLVSDLESTIITPINEELLNIVNALVSFIMFSLGVNYQYQLLKSKEIKLIEQKTEIEARNEEIEQLNVVISKNLSSKTRDLEIANEELIKKIKAIQNVNYRNSHQIRMPISNIIGLLDLYTKEENPVEKAEIVNKIRYSAHELDEIIRENNNLLNI